MNRLNTRQEKIKFLHDLAKGKATVKDILEPITGIVCTHNGEVFLEMGWNAISGSYSRDYEDKKELHEEK